MSVIERDHDELVDAVRRFGYASAAPSIGDPEARWREVREKITAMAERQRGAVEAFERIDRLRESWGEDWEAIGRAAWREAHDYLHPGGQSE